MSFDKYGQPTGPIGQRAARVYDYLTEKDPMDGTTAFGDDVRKFSL